MLMKRLSIVFILQERYLRWEALEIFALKNDKEIRNSKKPELFGLLFCSSDNIQRWQGCAQLQYSRANCNEVVDGNQFQLQRVFNW